jgi:hypothetical protein
MLRYLAIWFGLMVAELVLQFGVFAHRSDVLFVAMIAIFYWTLMFGLWGLIAKIGATFAGKAVRKGVRGIIREKRLAKHELALELVDILEKSNNKRADLNAYLKQHPSVPIRIR